MINAECRFYKTKGAGRVEVSIYLNTIVGVFPNRVIVEYTEDGETIGDYIGCEHFYIVGEVHE
jgi:hypothetical protein